jgi:hypothetical protein
MVRVEPGKRTLEEFFHDVPLGRKVYDAVAGLVDGLGPATVRVTKSQVAFRRRTGFGWVWLPGTYLPHPAADVVLSVGLARQDPSPRWKQTVQVSPTRWMHHLEVRDLADLDAEVEGWLAEAYELAG